MRYPRKNVALIYGGRGYEREVSLLGEKCLFPLIEQNFNCIPILIEKDGRWLTQDKKEVFCAKIRGRSGFFLPMEGNFLPIDCAFPLLHGNFGEDGIIQGALDSVDIPYVGCNGRVGAICRDKSILKAVAERLNIPTLPALVAKKGDRVIEEAERTIGYPMFVKPTSLGSSVGAGMAENRRELKEALEKAFSVCDKVIIERLLRPKRELECGYFCTKGKVLFTDVGEIITDGEFYDYERKYKSDKTRVSTRADVDQKINNRIREYSYALVRFLGIEQISRIDFFLSGDEIFFNEINTMPGFTEGSLYAKMLEDCGINRSRLILSLIEDRITHG